MAQFNFNINQIQNSLSEVYPEIGVDDNPNYGTDGKFFKNFDTFIQTTFQNGLVRLQLPIVNAANIYVFQCSLFQSVRVAFNLANVLAGTNLTATFKQVSIADIDAGIFTNLGTQSAAIIAPATAADKQIYSAALIPIIATGFAMEITPGVLNGSLNAYIIFNQEYDGETFGTLTPP